MKVDLPISALFTVLACSQQNLKMTKRTAALAAAAKLSTNNTAKNSIKKAVKKPAKKPSPAIVKSADQHATDLPWYTVFTKSDPEYDIYMATEWGMEMRGDVNLFEKICLEGAQSGLSWLTILRKREAYRKTFHNFDISKVADMTDKDVQKILDTTTEDSRNMIVRHRGKIEATINNAKCIQRMYQEASSSPPDTRHGLFDSFLWSFVQDKPILNTKWKQGQGLSSALSTSSESEAMSKALKKRGFRFVGPTTCYAMMQSVGMVIDHPQGSPEWQATLERLEKRPGGYQKDTDRNNVDTSESDDDQPKEPKRKRAKVATKDKTTKK
jgi:DNA-3-methyladenine glycosylase I